MSKKVYKQVKKVEKEIVAGINKLQSKKKAKKQQLTNIEEFLTQVKMLVEAACQALEETKNKVGPKEGEAKTEEKLPETTPQEPMDDKDKTEVRQAQETYLIDNVTIFTRCDEGFSAVFRSESPVDCGNVGFDRAFGQVHFVADAFN